MIPQLKSLLTAHEEGLMTDIEVHIRALQILMTDNVVRLKRGLGSEASSTCCCRYPHNLRESYLHADLLITPHGYSMKPQGSWWHKLISVFYQPKRLKPSNPL